MKGREERKAEGWDEGGEEKNKGRRRGLRFRKKGNEGEEQKRREGKRRKDGRIRGRKGRYTN